MPADSSSPIPIPPGLTPLWDASPLRPAEPPDLLAYLAAIPDPRACVGRRHPLIAILALAAAAVLAGARSFVAIAEWAADAPQPIRAALGARRDPLTGCFMVPTETTIRRTLGRLDAQALAFAPLLAPLDLAGVVVTADALQTHPEAAEFLVTGKQAHYLFIVKANQSSLLKRCVGLPWHRVPVLDRTSDRGHGRLEMRTLKVVSVGHFGFPHAAQVLQVTRKRKVAASHASTSTRRRRWQTVTVYAITSLPFELASPARLADLLRGHWAIEALHHLRDVTFAEDGSQVRTGAGPSVMACLRNLVIGVLCRAGPVNLAAALRHHARDPARSLATLGITPEHASW